MSELYDLQHRFMDYLLKESVDIIEDVQSTPVLSAKDRLDIYASAYKLRLKEAITSDHGKVASYLGDEQFDQLMECYIDKHPSNTTNLRYFSIHLPELVQNEAPFNSLAELYELACIERAFADSFDAKGIHFATLDQLATLPERAWETLQFKFQNSLQLLCLEHNTFAIWRALAEDSIPPKSEKTTATPWVLWRRADLISHYKVLSPAEFAVLDLALKGKNFAVICEKLLEFYDDEETPMKAIGFLQSWLAEEMLESFNW